MMMVYAGTKAGTECSSVKVMAGNAINARASNLPEKNREWERNERKLIHRGDFVRTRRQTTLL
tara:strand:- start:3190 stop:3378 length:189 start_codon:yes stop_codon:yes gene_type:complete